MHVVTELQQIGADVLRRGETSSGNLCPRCGGGSSHERSLSVWPHRNLPGVVVAKCWRNKCGYSEDVIVGEVAQGTLPARKLPAPTPIMRQLTDAAATFMMQRYRVGRGALDYWKVRQHPTINALYFPVLGPRREERGYVLRKFSKGAKPKAENVKLLPEQPFQAWLRHPTTQRIVIVEDFISAMRVWYLGFSAVALCGTNLSTEKLDEIKRAPRPKDKPIYLALDIDAISHAIALTRRDHTHIQPVRVWRDFKDSTDSEILACLN